MNNKKEQGNSNYENAAGKASQFCAALKAAKEKFLREDIPLIDEAKEALQKECKVAANAARETLSNHREWKGAIAKFLINLASGLTWGLTDNIWGMFRQADSGRKLDNFEKDIGIKSEM